MAALSTVKVVPAALALFDRLGAGHSHEVFEVELGHLADSVATVGAEEFESELDPADMVPDPRRDRPNVDAGACPKFDLRLPGQCKRRIAAGHRSDDGRDAVQRERLSRRRR